MKYTYVINYNEPEFIIIKTDCPKDEFTKAVETINNTYESMYSPSEDLVDLLRNNGNKVKIKFDSADSHFFEI